jgi:endonuclease/exonuclease/phosphatase family metal-dependent hydrolase
MPLDAGYMPEGWRWAYDPAVPTNRSIDAPYEKGRTPVSLIDFYLVSPNVRVVQVKALDQGFRSSDHQPVWMEVRFEG